MEDSNMLAADCIVLSCSSQCIILQLIFLLLRLPCKLFYKTRDFAKTRLRKTSKNLGKKLAQAAENQAMLKLYSMSSREGSSHGGFGFGRGSRKGCLEEVEKMLEELTQKGEFVFGSFWDPPSPVSLSKND